jgi:hypothetical protein
MIKSSNYSRMLVVYTDSMSDKGYVWVVDDIPNVYLFIFIYF